MPNLTPKHEETLRRTLKEIAEQKHTEGETLGIFDLTYQELIEASNHAIRNTTYASSFFKELQKRGKVKRLQRGTISQPSRWDVRRFIGIEVIEEPVTSIKVIPNYHDPASSTSSEENLASADEVRKVEPIREVRVVRAEQAPDEVTTGEVTEDTRRVPVITPKQAKNNIRDAICEMTEYLKVLPDQMITHLNKLAEDLEPSNIGKIEEIERKYKDAKEEIKTLKEQVDKLIFDLKIKDEELKKRKEIHLNKNALVRYRNHILDETERFIAAPTWQRKGMEDNFRTTVSEKLTNILVEVGIGDNHGDQTNR